jgi:hypothetical protein
MRGGVGTSTGASSGKKQNIQVPEKITGTFIWKCQAYPNK